MESAEPVFASLPSRILLTKPIAAVQLEIGGDGNSRLGLLSQLPPGVEIAICGDGFNERTAKVTCHGHFYFVFLQDLDPADK